MRNYYDPHYKADRSPSKYRADKRRDAIGASDAAAFVAKFLATRKTGTPTSRDTAEVFKNLRIEARRFRVAKPSRSIVPKGIRNTPKITEKKRKSAKNARRKRAVQAPQNRPWLKRHGSLKFLKLSDDKLIATYYNVDDKIEKWRAERAQTVDEKRKRVLAEQVQIQLEKRHDLLELIYHRAIGEEVAPTLMGGAMRAKQC